jgi:hypothetical protein
MSGAIPFKGSLAKTTLRRGSGLPEIGPASDHRAVLDEARAVVSIARACPGYWRTREGGIGGQFMTSATGQRQRADEYTDRL